MPVSVEESVASARAGSSCFTNFVSSGLISHKFTGGYGAEAAVCPITDEYEELGVGSCTEA